MVEGFGARWLVGAMRLFVGLGGEAVAWGGCLWVWDVVAGGFWGETVVCGVGEGGPGR